MKPVAHYMVLHNYAYGYNYVIGYDDAPDLKEYDRLVRLSDYESLKGHCDTLYKALQNIATGLHKYGAPDIALEALTAVKAIEEGC